MSHKDLLPSSSEVVDIDSSRQPSVAPSQWQSLISRFCREAVRKVLTPLIIASASLAPIVACNKAEDPNKVLKAESLSLDGKKYWMEHVLEVLKTSMSDQFILNDLSRSHMQLFLKDGVSRLDPNFFGDGTHLDPISETFPSAQTIDTDFRIGNFFGVGRDGNSMLFSRSSRYIDPEYVECGDMNCYLGYDLITFKRDEKGIHDVALTPIIHRSGNPGTEFVNGLRMETFDLNDAELVALMTQVLNAFDEYRVFLDKLKSDQMSKDKLDGLPDSPEFNEKLQKGTVELVLGVKGREVIFGAGTGFIYDERTVVTARHCFEDNDVHLHGVNTLIPSRKNAVPSRKRVAHNLSEKDYIVVSDDDQDLAVVIFKKPIFDKSLALKVASSPTVNNRFYIGHFLDYDVRSQSGDWGFLGGEWQIDPVNFIMNGVDTMSCTRYEYKYRSGRFKSECVSSVNIGVYSKVKFSDGNSVKGNSGGPIVNERGEVVSVYVGGWEDGDEKFERGASISDAKIKALKDKVMFKFVVEDEKVRKKVGKKSKKNSFNR